MFYIFTSSSKIKKKKNNIAHIKIVVCRSEKSTYHSQYTQCEICSVFHFTVSLSTVVKILPAIAMRLTNRDENFIRERSNEQKRRKNMQRNEFIEKKTKNYTKEETRISYVTQNYHKIYTPTVQF